MARNQYGLSRDIPDHVRRSVRQRDGFGCVICGRAIYEYEHIEPEFTDAREHSVAGIVLLCNEHHGLKTRRLLSKQTILAASERPRARQQGFSFGPFDIGMRSPTIQIGTLRARNIDTLVEILGDSVLSIRPPLEGGAPFLIDACLRDRDGAIIFEISDNEWRTPSENWDVDIQGNHITIRRKLGDILLSIRSDPPDQLVIERLDMVHRGVRISCREGVPLTIETENGTCLSASEVHIEGVRVAIRFDGASIALGYGRRIPIRRNLFVLRRNELCPCGSGRKHKHCHGKF